MKEGTKSKQQSSVEVIARACYEANAVYAESIGEETLPWQVVKDSVVNGVETLIADPSLTPAEMHDNWAKFKVEDGWTYGEEKDTEKKTHPQLVPYEDLPEEQRVKDYLFQGIVRALAKLPKGYVTA
jgi:RyR domain